MRIRQILTYTILLATVIGAAVAQDKGKMGRGPAGPGMTLTSPAFADGTEIPRKYTQSEVNLVSPKLEWANVPAVQGKNGGGLIGYRGPGAPTVGSHHHYAVELFALDTMPVGRFHR